MVIMGLFYDHELFVDCFSVIISLFVASFITTMSSVYNLS